METPRKRVCRVAFSALAALLLGSLLGVCIKDSETNTQTQHQVNQLMRTRSATAQRPTPNTMTKGIPFILHMTNS